MKNKMILVGSTLAALHFSAQAQSSVTIYGIVDAAVAIEDTGAPGTSSRKVLNSGNQSSSRFGFRGTEDLGQGLKAFFNVESGLAVDTGATETAFFGRRSVVGLESASFGSVILGREYSPIASVAAASDIFGQGFFGTNLSAFNTGRLTRRMSNSVSYKTPSFGGVRGTLSASASEGVPGSSRLLGAALEYTTGPIYVGGGYHELKRVTGGQKDKEYSFGLGYDFGMFDVKGNYLVADPAGGGNKFEQINFGASAPIGPGRLYGNVQQNRMSGGGRGTGLAATYSYELSKRTNLYASYARLSNNTQGRFGLNSSSTNVTPVATAPGADPSVMAVGIRHRF